MSLIQKRPHWRGLQVHVAVGALRFGLRVRALDWDRDSLVLFSFESYWNDTPLVGAYLRRDGFAPDKLQAYAALGYWRWLRVQP